MGKIIGTIILTIIISWSGVGLMGEAFLVIGVPAIITGTIAGVGIILYKEIKNLANEIEILRKELKDIHNKLN